MSVGGLDILVIINTWVIQEDLFMLGIGVRGSIENLTAAQVNLILNGLFCSFML